MIVDADDKLYEWQQIKLALYSTSDRIEGCLYNDEENNPYLTQLIELIDDKAMSLVINRIRELEISLTSQNAG